MILAMETGGELASLALLDDMEVVAEVAFRHRMQLSRNLLPEIEALLERVQVGWEAVEAVAVGLGPGSFTGLRIGVVTAKALAWASQRPVLGIASLSALVAPYEVSPETLLCAVLEARSGEFFTAAYQRRNGELLALTSPTVLTASELAGRLSDHPGPVLVAGHRARFARSISRCDGSSGEGEAGVVPMLPSPVSMQIDEEPQARWVGRLAVERLRAGERDHPAALTPLYMRAPMPTLRHSSSFAAR
jgi:tRNA threonylcarbamoyladenosine biosynthesis protein TsaB